MARRRAPSAFSRQRPRRTDTRSVIGRLLEASDGFFGFLARELAPSRQAHHRSRKNRGQIDNHDRAGNRDAGAGAIWTALRLQNRPARYFARHF